MEKADGELCTDDQEDLRWAAAAMLGGGLDTVSVPLHAIKAQLWIFYDPAPQSRSAILSFFMAMVLYPDVQKKAHAELDAVVGATRLPCIPDRAELPYVRSIVSEVLRWAPPAPIGTPFSFLSALYSC